MTTISVANSFLNKGCNSRKYSNYTLFNRRETEYSSIKQKNTSNNTSSIRRPYSSSIKKIFPPTITKRENTETLTKSKTSNKFSANQSSIYSKKSSKTIKNRRIHVEDYFHKKNKSKINQANVLESILNLEKYYTPNTSFKKKISPISNINVNININKYFNDLNYINQIYLTEANIKKNPLNKKEKTINFNYFNLDDYNEYIYNDFNDFSKTQNADILVKFYKDKSSYDSGETLKTEYNDRMINFKRRRINLCKERREEFMAQTRNEKYDKLALNSKKELFKRINETHQNKLEYIRDRISSFEKWKTLNHDFFVHKISDYLKFLMYKKAYEKNKVEGLIEEIIEVKKELNIIYTKMAKIELEKNKILRWVYFQIKLKEKKLILPNYYKLILENIISIDDYFEKVRLKKENNTEINQSNYLRDSMNSITHSPSPSASPRKKQKRPIMKTSIDKVNPINNNNINNDLMSFLNKREGKKEYMRIKEYKNNLIYKSAEEFYEALLSMENEDLRLIEYYDYIQGKINSFQKELEKEKKEKIIRDNMYNYTLNNKLNELSQLKNRCFALETSINNWKKNKNNNNNNNKEIIKKRNKSACITTKKIQNKKNNKMTLISKINKLFNICKLVKFKNRRDYEVLDAKRKEMKNNEIIYYFMYIEYCVNYLLSEIEKFKETHKDGEKELKKIYFEIEKGHRIEKTEALRRQLREKYIKLETEVNKRNNKIYLLPYRKVANAYKIKKEKVVKEEKGDSQPKFEDFIENDHNNYYSYNNYEEEKY